MKSGNPADSYRDSRYRQSLYFFGMKGAIENRTMTANIAEKKQIMIGDYIITGKIGQGGIAEIFRGRQESLERDVAIKVLHSRMTAIPEIVRRFERESIVVAKLNHPNIVHIIDKGTAGGRYYFVMEFVDGTSLREVIDSTRIPLATKLDMIVQVCKGLDYAHKNGVIHRDIKPANILIDRQGHAMIADFGIAQIVTTEVSEMTATDVIMGTVAYMSPEQKVSSTNVDQTTDIYATGVMLYEILVGKKPLGRFKMPSEAKPGIDPKFDGIIHKCLAQEPSDRYASAVELKDAILDAVGGADGKNRTDEFSMSGSDSFLGKCRYLDTIKENRHSSTILVENRLTKKLFVITKHSKGEAGRKEATILKSLQHPNIIRVYGSGGDKKQTVIITEYAQGGSLADRMVRPWDWERAFKMILDVATGLDFAHRNNVVHGNLRPSNILLDADDVPKISDFGTPVHYDGVRKKNWYSAPERKTSRTGDIYGLGVMLHQLMTGTNPGYDIGSNLLLDGLKDKIPEDVCHMLRKMLSIRVGNRYSSCEGLLLDWDDFDQARKDRSRQRIVKNETPKDEKPIPVWVYAAAAAGIIVLVLAIMWVGGVFNT
jgi:serine/threonine-protein kinase